MQTVDYFLKLILILKYYTEYLYNSTYRQWSNYGKLTKWARTPKAEAFVRVGCGEGVSPCGEGVSPSPYLLPTGGAVWGGAPSPEKF